MKCVNALFLQEAFQAPPLRSGTSPAFSTLACLPPSRFCKQNWALLRDGKGMAIHGPQQSREGRWRLGKQESLKRLEGSCPWALFLQWAGRQSLHFTQPLGLGWVLAASRAASPSAPVHLPPTISRGPSGPVPDPDRAEPAKVLTVTSLWSRNQFLHSLQETSPRVPVFVCG